VAIVLTLGMIKQKNRYAFAKSRKSNRLTSSLYPVATIAVRASVQPQNLQASQSWEDS
jgi:hypothetical protein